MDILPHASGLVPGPGLYRVADPALYHGDCAPEPSLNSSAARLLIERSAAHACAAHPRLAPQAEAEGRDPTRPMEVGTVAHKLILGQGAEVVILDADDYKKPATREARAAAYAAGRAPILHADRAKAQAVADAVAGRLAEIPGCEGFGSAPAEVVAVAQDRSGLWLRTMMDRIEVHDRHAIIWDVKSGEQSAAPHALGRRIAKMGMEVQAALYVRVLETLFPHLAGRVLFRWIMVENDAPHGVTVAQADAVTLGVGARKVALAIHLFNEARATGVWTGYPAEIVSPAVPGWAEGQWSEREEAEDAAARGRGAPILWDVSASPFRPLEPRIAA